MNCKNIILIGMPGAGKSTVGVILAKTARMLFIDTDLVIQEKENMTLQEIINMHGPDKFLEVEEEAILGLKAGGSVIATGGSVVYSKAAMEHLKKSGTAVYLMLPFEEIEERINNITTRGIAMGPGESLRDIYERRVPLYEEYADITVDCSNKNLERVVEEIISSVFEKKHI